MLMLLKWPPWQFWDGWDGHDCPIIWSGAPVLLPETLSSDGHRADDEVTIRPPLAQLQISPKTFSCLIFWSFLLVDS